MRKRIIIGSLILIIGGLTFPFLINEILGLAQALSIGLVVGGAFSLKSQFRNN